MITVLPSRQSDVRRGARPINLRHDAPAVLRLLDVAFGDELDPENRRHLQRSLVMVSQPWYRPLLMPAIGDVPGYVWEENGQIVGNISLMTSRSPERHIIANVAVHPNWRRRGIARSLMTLALDHLASRRAAYVLLQVKQHNEGARQLYETLGFTESGTLTTWIGRVTEVTDVAPDGNGPPVRPLRRRDAGAAYGLDLASLHPDLHWPDPLAHDAYATGLWTWVSNLFIGRKIEHWATRDGHDRLTGVASIVSEWGRPHELSLRVHPDSRGQLERTLLSKLIRRAGYLPRQRLRLDHAADDALTNRLLESARLRPQRTLVVMRYSF